VALAERDATALNELAARFEGMGAYLLAAEAAADAVVEARRLGLRRQRFDGERQVKALLVQCQDVTTPTLRNMQGETFLLTRREREVAMLASTGRSNKEIAEQLDISVRTVENQLHRAYEKLGIAKRDEIAAALNAMGSEPG